LSEKVDRLNEKVDRLESNYVILSDKVDRLDEKVDRLESNYVILSDKFDRLDEKVDRLDKNVKMIRGELAEKTPRPLICHKFGESFSSQFDIQGLSGLARLIQSPKRETTKYYPKKLKPNELLSHDSTSDV
jgi:predicted nuclease with TOPRIM domain